jgi:beta-N-acetylhexosaminidase
MEEMRAVAEAAPTLAGQAAERAAAALARLDPAGDGLDVPEARAQFAAALAAA